MANSCQLQSSLAPSFLLSSKRFHAIKSPVIFYTNFHENSGEITLNEPRLPASIVLTERRSGASDHDDKKKKTAVTRPRPDGGVKNHRKKMGITRLRPDGGVKKTLHSSALQSEYNCYYYRRLGRRVHININF